jgi:hypothetical protein
VIWRFASSLCAFLAKMVVIAALGALAGLLIIWSLL